MRRFCRVGTPCPPFGSRVGSRRCVGGHRVPTLRLNWSLGLAISCFTTHAVACSPPAWRADYKHPPIESIAIPLIEQSAYILEVKIEKVEEDWSKQTRRIRFTPIRSLKGPMPTARYFESPMTACDHVFERFVSGETDIIFLSSTMRNVFPRDGDTLYYKSQTNDYAKYKLSTK